MCENPDLFEEYLMPVLDDIRGEDVSLSDTLTPEDVGVTVPEGAAD